MRPIRRLDPHETVPFHATVGNDRFGPFENHAAARGWEDIVARRRDMSLATACALYEGRIGGDAVYDVDTLAIEFGMHPFREVHDIGCGHDNGEVMLDFARGSRFLPPDAIVLVQGATRYEPTRRLERPERVPERISLDMDNRETEVKAPHPAGGQLLVVESYRKDSPRYLTVWRRDARMRMDLRVVSGHSTLEYADMRLDEAMERFTPSAGELAGRRITRLRDYQREKVYFLEARIGGEHGQGGRLFSSIGECADFVRQVYEECGLGAPPAVSLGRANQERSYFKRSVGIVMAPSQMNAWTALHEAAHHVARRIATEPGHGPTFVSTLMGMLAAYEGIDLDMMVGLAEQEGVDFSPELVEAWRERLGARASTAPAP